MPCKACEDRRKRISQAKTDDGWKGVARILPVIAREMVVKPKEAGL